MRTVRAFAGALLAAAIVAVGAGAAAAAGVTKGGEDTAGGTTMKGFLAWDADAGKKVPGVLVVHEWWGLNAYARRRARMLAELGYAALAVDMYGDGRTADHPEDAGKFSAALMKNADAMRERFMAAYDFLRAQPQVDPGRIAAVGYCMGGGVALNMARAGVDLRGVATFHGALNAVIPATPGGIKAKLLVFTGGADKFVTAEAVEAFRAEMAAAGADLAIVTYPEATHSFTNPEADEYAKRFGMPIAYDKAADEDSWERLTAFLAEVLK